MELAVSNIPNNRGLDLNGVEVIVILVLDLCLLVLHQDTLIE